MTISNRIIEVIEKFISIISNLSGEQIALFSIIITFMIYALGKNNELRMKKHEAKKEQYIKLIKFFEKVFDISKGDNKELMLNSIDKSEFFDMGSSILIYGSLRLYRQYLFYREFSTNPLVRQSKYYNDRLSLYLLADIFRTIRREVGLTNISGISKVEALGFFVNDINYLPKSKIESYQARCDIAMIKFELFLFDRYYLVTTHFLYHLLIQPILRFISVLWKYLFMIPLGRLILKINPNAQADIVELEKKLADIKKKH